MNVLNDHPTALLFVLGGIPLLLLFKRWFRPKVIPGIPHFPIKSVWGDLPVIMHDTEAFGTFMENGAFVPKAIKELGPIFQFFLGPFDTMVVIADAQEIEDVLLRSKLQKLIEPSYTTRSAFLGVIPYGMVSLKTDDMWRRHRRVTTPVMTSTYLSQMSPAISQNAQHLVEFWKKKIVITKAFGGECFSSQSDFEYSTLDTISEIIAGRPINAVEHALAQLPECVPVLDVHGGATFPMSHQPLFTALRYFVGVMGTATQLPSTGARAYYAYLAFTPTFRRHTKVVDDHIGACVVEARRAVEEAKRIGEEPTPAKSLVGMVVQRESIPGQDKLTEKELRDEALTFLLAGHDTTSQSFQWCIKFFAKAPHVQHALRKELTSALEDAPDKRSITYADVSSPDRTPYLDAVVQEVLRCGRVAQATSKTTLEPITLLGCNIPVGTNLIFMNSIACDDLTPENLPRIRAMDGARSESSVKSGLNGRGLWTDPKVFDPERWLVQTDDGKRKFNPKAGYSLPFGVGLRSCAGKALAQLELKIFIATLNLAFFFEKVPEELDSPKPIQGISRAPLMAYVAPRLWGVSE